MSNNNSAQHPGSYVSEGLNEKILSMFKGQLSDDIIEALSVTTKLAGITSLARNIFTQDVEHHASDTGREMAAKSARRAYKAAEIFYEEVSKATKEEVERIKPLTIEDIA